MQQVVLNYNISPKMYAVALVLPYHMCTHRCFVGGKDNDQILSQNKPIQ